MFPRAVSVIPAFASFWMGGFECACHINGGGRRLDMLAVTQHDVQVAHDYRLLRSVGIRTARDGVRWPLIDRAGRYDFTSFAPAVRAAAQQGIQVVWDLSMSCGSPCVDHTFRKCGQFLVGFALFFTSFAAESSPLRYDRGTLHRRGLSRKPFWVAADSAWWREHLRSLPNWASVARILATMAAGRALTLAGRRRRR